MKHFLFFTLLLSLSACRFFMSKEQRESEAAQKDFEKFAGSLPVIQLPYHTSCYECCKFSMVNLDSIAQAKYNPEGLYIYGKLGVLNGHTLVFGAYPSDINSPTLLVFDIEGKLIDEQYFLTDYCGGDFDFYGKQAIYIDKDYSVTERDTSYYFKMDTLNFEVTDTEKIEIKRMAYVVTQEGKIVKKTEEKSVN
ncbi:MAG: hypothetical protein U0V74_12930 [Chitinophagales bacterium]